MDFNFGTAAAAPQAIPALGLLNLLGLGHSLQQPAPAAPAQGATVDPQQVIQGAPYNVHPAIAAALQAQMFGPALDYYRNQQQQPQSAAPQGFTPPVQLAPPQPAAPRTLPPVSAPSPGTDRFNPAALMTRMAFLHGGVDPAMAARNMGEQRLDEVMNGSTAQAAARQALQQGVPFVQAAALGREQAAAGAPDVMGLYGLSPYYAPDQKGIEALNNSLTGHMWQTGDAQPVNTFLGAGGNLNQPTGTTSYQPGTTADGRGYVYDNAPGRTPAAMTDVSQAVPMSPADLWRADAERRKATMDFTQKMLQEYLMLQSSENRGVEAARTRALTPPNILFGANSSLSPEMQMMLLQQTPYGAALSPYLTGGYGGYQ